MSYVAFMVIGHGSLVTQTNQEGLIDIVPIEFPSINMQICTFAPPLECSVYPDDSLLLLRKTIQTYLKDVNTINTFQQAVGQAQLDAIRFKYSDPDWAGHSTVHPKSYHLSENWVTGNKYIDKTYSNANEIFKNGESGIYILNNNIGLQNGHFPFENERTTLSNIITYFSRVDNICILDTTCSVIHEELSERSERLIKKNISLLFQSTRNGRAKGIITKKINKKRRKSKKRNKTIQNNRKNKI
jgi:hypothetical protein